MPETDKDKISNMST